MVQVAIALSHALSWRSEFGQATVGHAQKQAVGAPAALGTRRTARGRTRGARSTDAVAGRSLFCWMRVALRRTCWALDGQLAMPDAAAPSGDLMVVSWAT